jgi:hypothetical protein
MKRAIELSPSEAIIHDGKKYRVDSVITEKNLSTIVSSSLTYPHKKVVFSTSPEVEFQTSPLETQSYLVRRRVGKTEFMLSAKIKYILEGRLVLLTQYYFIFYRSDSTK